MKIPSFMLKQLYVKNSLENVDDGFEFGIKNTLANSTITGSISLTIDNKSIPTDAVGVLSDSKTTPVADISKDHEFLLEVDKQVTIQVKGESLSPGEHTIEIKTTTKEFGDIKFSITDSVKA
jgi:hydroxymethylglutaryl-CoA reductase (NADPH)